MCLWSETYQIVLLLWLETKRTPITHQISTQIPHSVFQGPAGMKPDLLPACLPTARPPGPRFAGLLPTPWVLVYTSPLPWPPPPQQSSEPKWWKAVSSSLNSTLFMPFCTSNIFSLCCCYLRTYLPPLLICKMLEGKDWVLQMFLNICSQ